MPNWCPSRCMHVGIALGMTWSMVAPGADNDTGAPPIWRLEFDNDLVFNTDDQLSAGWSLQRHSAAAADWSSVHAPRWLAGLGAYIPGLDRSDHVKRMGMGIGQVIQTPEDLEREDYIPDDVPYAASLGVFFSWTAISPEHIAGCQLYLGTIGEPALGEEAQSTVHGIFAGDDPQGWDNQVGFEPVINLSYGSWWRFADAGDNTGLGADLAGGGFLSIGNLATMLDGVAQARIGWNLPRGFAPIPDPGGFGVAQVPRVGPPEDFAAYISIAGRARAIGYSVFFDGSLFDADEPEAPDREFGTLQAIVGAHFLYQTYAARAHLVFSTDPIDSSASSRSWGALTLEASF